MASRISDNAILWMVISTCAALLIPALFMDGMFIDGVQYAAVSRNFAQGYGSLWEMKFSETMYPAFHEQPPLMFVLQGLFFKVLGNSMYTERIYCAVAAVLNSVVLMKSWKLLQIKSDTAWLPLLFWFIMPVTFWAFTNNVEECTMGLFVLLAFNSVLRGMANGGDFSVWWIIAGAWILAAGLTKGIQGMFLLAAPFWIWVALRNGGFKSFVMRSTLIGIIPGVFVLIAWFTPEIHNSFQAYFNSRFGKTFSGVTATNSHHFQLLQELFLNILAVAVIASVMWITTRKSGHVKQGLKSNSRMMLFVLLCGLSGILPLMVTKEQRGFYLVTALPLVALAIALIFEPAADQWSRTLRSKKTVSAILTAFALVTVSGALIAAVILAGKPKRDADKLGAIEEIAAITGERVILVTENSIARDWPFLAYAQRFQGLSFTTLEGYPTEWLLLEKGTPVPQGGYTPEHTENSLFRLYRRNR